MRRGGSVEDISGLFFAYLGDIKVVSAVCGHIVGLISWW